MIQQHMSLSIMAATATGAILGFLGGAMSVLTYPMMNNSGWNMMTYGPSAIWIVPLIGIICGVIMGALVSIIYNAILIILQGPMIEEHYHMEGCSDCMDPSEVIEKAPVRKKRFRKTRR